MSETSFQDENYGKSTLSSNSFCGHVEVNFDKPEKKIAERAKTFRLTPMKQWKNDFFPKEKLLSVFPLDTYNLILNFENPAESVPLKTLKMSADFRNLRN